MRIVWLLLVLVVRLVGCRRWSVLVILFFVV